MSGHPQGGTLAVVALLASLAGCGPETAQRLHETTPLASAVNRAADFLSTRRLEHAELWFVHQASRRLGRGFPQWAAGLRDNGPPDWAESVLADLRDLDVHRFPPLPAPTAIPLHPSASLAGSAAETMNLIGTLFFAVRQCSREDHDRDQRLRELLAVETSGYLLAHQAWTLAVGVSRGCLAAEEVEPRRREMAMEIMSELVSSDGLTDLDLERMAILCMLDLCYWVPKEFFDRAIERQLPSGSWGTPAPPGVDSKDVREEHAAALGFYALASLFELSQRSRPWLDFSCARAGGGP